MFFLIVKNFSYSILNCIRPTKNFNRIAKNISEKAEKISMKTKMQFIAGPMLGKLCQYLRMLGFDCEFFTGKTQHEIFRQALRQQRIILTRNQKLRSFQNRYSIVVLKGDSTNEQLKQMFERLPLALEPSKFFTRCLKCNGEIQQIEKESVAHRVPPYVFATQKAFYRCNKCQQIYWPATHLENMNKQIKELIKSLHLPLVDDKTPSDQT